MFKPAFLRSWCWAMVLLFPAATVLADIGPAVIHGTGDLRVNGKRTEKATSVFAGDRLQTGPESSATLSARGSTLMIGPSSDVTYDGTSVRLNAGRIAVLTSRGLGIGAGNFAVKPATAERARFEVRREAGALQISAREGSLSVSNGTDMVLVEQGKTLDQSANAKAPGLPKATASIAQGLAIGLAIAAAVTAGVAFAVRNDEVSPTGP